MDTSEFVSPFLKRSKANGGRSPKGLTSFNSRAMSAAATELHCPHKAAYKFPCSHAYEPCMKPHSLRFRPEVPKTLIPNPLPASTLPRGPLKSELHTLGSH